MTGDKKDVIASAQAERRQHRRIPVALGGRVFFPEDGREAECDIVDMSPGGAQVRCEFIPPQGTLLVIYIDSFGRFEGTVARVADDNFGVRFKCSALKRERVAEQLTMHVNGGICDESVLRRYERNSANGMARFTRATGEIVTGEVLDLSLGGVSLKTDLRPPLGEFVLIAQVAGKVVRHHENGIAIEFVGGPPAKVMLESPAPLLRVAR